MTHWDEGRLRAYLDGELAPGEAAAARKHLDACTRCATAVDALREDHARLRAALAAWEVDYSGRADRVRTELQARAGRTALDARAAPAAGRPQLVPATSAAGKGPLGPGRVPRGWVRGKRMLQAAVWVLLLAGGASALVPGSPVRDWLTRSSSQEDVQPAAASPVAEPASVEGAAQTGVRVAAASGSVLLTLELPSGSELVVRVVEGERAAVFAPAGARFRSGEGRLEAWVPSGPVQVELPADVAEASLAVGSRTYVTVQDGRLDAAEPADARSPTEVRFRIP